MLRARQQKSGGEEGSEPPDAQSALINWVEQGDCAGLRDRRPEPIRRNTVARRQGDYIGAFSCQIWIEAVSELDGGETR